MLPGDPGWDAARSGFNLLDDQHPAAVAFPADATDVAAAVRHAGRAGLRVAPQATGHNQGPLGDLDDASAFFAPETWAHLRAIKALRRRRPVRREPPHPAGALSRVTARPRRSP